MNQLINTNQEDNNTVTQVSLEGRANQIYEFILNNCNDLHLANFHQHLDELSGKIFLSDEEKKAVLPYILNKITQKIITDYSQRSIVLDFGSIADPKQFLMIALNQLFIEMILDQKLAVFDYLALNQAALGGVQLAYISILQHFRLFNDNHSNEIFITQYDARAEFFSLALEFYPSGSLKRNPAYWIYMFHELQGNEREFLKSVPFIWGEAEFRSYIQPGFNQSHVRIDGKQYKINRKARNQWERVQKNNKKMEKHGWKRQVMIKEKAVTVETNDTPQWCVYMTLHDEGPSIEFVPTTYNNKFFAFEMNLNGGVSGEIGLNRTIVLKPDEEEINKNIKNLFEDLFIPYGQFFDEQVFVTSLDNLRKFDIQNSIQKIPTASALVVENVSHNTTTLTNKTFIDPKQHHINVARSLGLDIIDHSGDIGAAEAIGSNHLRYKNQNGESSLHYLPKIAWLIDILEDIIPKNEHGKITAYTLPSSPYIFVYTNTDTIFISDIDNVSTQVFAQKVDPSFVNSDFSFPKLGELFGPLTSIKNNFEEVISDESAESWAQHILSALNKKDGYFLDLIDDEHHDWGVNLHALYQSGEITKKDFATPMDLEQFLKGHNQKLLHNSSIPNKQKKSLSFANSRGKVPSTQVLINMLGGNKFFTWYHGHTSVFCEYFDTLLSNNGEQRDSIFEQLRSNHTARISIKSWIDELKNQTRTLSETQFYGLFSTDTYIKKMMRKELELPSGLFTSISWIIAFGYDPEKLVGGETSEMYLYRILVEEGIIKNKI